MQTSSQSSGAEKALSGLKGRSKRKQGCVEVDQNGSKGGKKPINKRKARTSGNAKPSKQRPQCRVHWKNEKNQHPALRFYSVVLREEMDKLGWSMRDLATASRLSLASVQRFLSDKRLPGLDQDLRLTRGLKLSLHYLVDTAILLHKEAKAGRK